MKKNRKRNIALFSVLLFLLISGIIGKDQIIDFTDNIINNNQNYTSEESYTLDSIPAYNNEDYAVIDDNKPDFTEEDYNRTSFEKYGELDSLGRCTGAFALVSKETMPTEERGSIGMVKPTGWHTVKYDIVDGKYLYNRCHLIGYQLTGENANTKNLITCTRQMNTEGMLDFENEVADYVENTGDSVLYRVTPIFEEGNLLASGVQMEAASVSDKCGEVCFNVYVYNVQDGIEINYQTGDSKLAS